MSRASRRREARDTRRQGGAQEVSDRRSWETAPGQRDASINTARLMVLVPLAVVSLSCWALAHVPTQVAPFLGFIGAITGIAAGIISPTTGVALAIAIVPFRGAADTVTFGFTEFFRGAPLWGAAVRLVWDRVIAARRGESLPVPSRIITAAAIFGALIAPLQRITATTLGTFPAQGTLADMFGIAGGQSLFFAAWLVAAHLPRNAITRLTKVAAVTISVALVLSFAGWILSLTKLFEVSPIEFLTFKAKVVGRLGSLGYPTPTAMGLAISMPLIAGVAFRYSRVAGAALIGAATLAIILTESRGPMIALGVMAIVMIPSIKLLRGPRLLALFGVMGASGFALFFNRYGGRLQELFAGSIPNIESDLQRITSWRAGIETALAHPLTGGGWFSLRLWNDGELGRANVNLSHNIILQGLSDGGFPLGIAAATIVLGSLFWAVKHWRSVPLPWRLAAVAVLVCGLWDMPQLRAFGALFAGFSLGLVARGGYETSEEPAVHTSTGELPAE